MRPIRTPVLGVAAVCLVTVPVGCSGGDGPNDEITRIDGPAVVDEDRDGQLDG